ncbi:MAG TPA: SRPBCC family protein [Steroidobacteraceae bacterium]|nr:SRPBCC family protein [Steroidobacteraceae bacterium]
MTVEVAHHLGAVRRSVRSLERDGRPARAVILTRTYDTDQADLWNALTSPERLPRWFLPVEGDLKLGGRYQLKGNAGGTITDCEPPAHLGLTWEMRGQVSWVEVRLERESATRTRFTLTHTAPLSDFWKQFGPGAVGVGWELGLMGMALHLADPAAKFDEVAFAASPESRVYMTGSSEKWGEAAIAGGEDPDQARAAVRNTTAFYTGQPPA